MEKQIIEFITSIARFPSLDMWQKNGLYCCECSPSPEIVRGEGDTLQKALLELLKGLNDYLSPEETITARKIINEIIHTMPRDEDTELSKEELLELENLQIVKEHILQLNNGVCSFYDHAKIHDLSTRKDYYINWEEAEVMFKLISAYHKTQLKRLGMQEETIEIKDED